MSGFGIPKHNARNGRVTKTHAPAQHRTVFAARHLRSHRIVSLVKGDQVFPDGLEPDAKQSRAGYAAFTYAGSSSDANLGSISKLDSGDSVRTVFHYFNGAPKSASFALAGIYIDSEGTNLLNDPDAQGAIAYLGETELFWTGFGPAVVDEPLAILPPNGKWSKAEYDQYIRVCNPDGKGTLALGYCVMIRDFLTPNEAGSISNPYEAVKDIHRILVGPLNRLLDETLIRWGGNADLLAAEQDAKDFDPSVAGASAYTIGSSLVNAAVDAIADDLKPSEDSSSADFTLSTPTYTEDVKEVMNDIPKNIFEDGSLFNPDNYSTKADRGAKVTYFKIQVNRIFAHWLTTFHSRRHVVHGCILQAAAYQEYLGQLVTGLQLLAQKHLTGDVAVADEANPTDEEREAIADANAKRELVYELGLHNIYYIINTVYGYYCRLFDGGVCDVIRYFYCGRIMLPMNTETHMVLVAQESKAFVRT